MQVDLYYDPKAMRGGRMGCWKARLTETHAINGAGTTKEEAISSLIITAVSHGYSGNPDDYQIVEI